MNHNFKWETDTSTKRGHSFIGDTYKQMQTFCNNCGYELRVSNPAYMFLMKPEDYIFKGNRFNIKLKKGKVSKVWIG